MTKINIDTRLQEAVQSYWGARAKNKEKQVQSGRIDAGSRSEVTGGTQMGALEVLVADILCEAGLKRLDVRTRTALELPGCAPAAAPPCCAPKPPSRSRADTPTSGSPCLGTSPRSPALGTACPGERPRRPHAINHPAAPAGSPGLPPAKPAPGCRAPGLPAPAARPAAPRAPPPAGTRQHGRRPSATTAERQRRNRGKKIDRAP